MKITFYGSCILLSCLILLPWSGIARAQDSMLARTPPMGWNSWNHFACEVSDAVVRAQADAIVTSGSPLDMYTSSSTIAGKELGTLQDTFVPMQSFLT
jgi:hypothetical protein